MTDRAIPGGRGPRKGPDASVNQRESDVQRASLVSAEVEKYYAVDTHGIGCTDVFTDRALAANTLYLSPAMAPPQTFVGGFLRAQATAAVSPAYLDVGLYALDRAARILTLAPKTIGRLSWTATGIATQALETLVRPSASLYYFACRRGLNALTLRSVTRLLGGTNIFPRAFTLAATAPLPGRITLDSAAFDAASEMPAFLFTSNAWDSILR